MKHDLRSSPLSKKLIIYLITSGHPIKLFIYHSQNMYVFTISLALVHLTTRTKSQFFRIVNWTKYSSAVYYQLLQSMTLCGIHYLESFKFQFLDGNLKFTKSLFWSKPFSSLGLIAALRTVLYKQRTIQLVPTAWQAIQTTHFKCLKDSRQFSHKTSIVASPFQYLVA